MLDQIKDELEAKRWETTTKSYYRLIVQIDGIGLDREFPALESKDKFYQGAGKTEAEVMAMVAQAKRKGLKPTLFITTETRRRLA